MHLVYVGGSGTTAAAPFCAEPLAVITAHFSYSALVIAVPSTFATAFPATLVSLLPQAASVNAATKKALSARRMRSDVLTSRGTLANTHERVRQLRQSLSNF